MQPAQSNVSDVSHDRLLSMTSTIVSAYAANNSFDSDKLSATITSVYKTLAKLTSNEPEVSEPPVQEPAVPIRKSVFPDHIVCLEDGKRLKMLKRHLKTSYNITPEEYRQKWNLPRDYPMVAPDYAKHRSSLAKSIGLGRGKTKSAVPEPKPVPVRVIPEGKSGRKKAA